MKKVMIVFAVSAFLALTLADAALGQGPTPTPTPSLLPSASATSGETFTEAPDGSNSEAHSGSVVEGQVVTVSPSGALGASDPPIPAPVVVDRGLPKTGLRERALRSGALFALVGCFLVAVSQLRRGRRRVPGTSGR